MNEGSAQSFSNPILRWRRISISLLPKSSAVLTKPLLTLVCPFRLLSEVKLVETQLDSLACHRTVVQERIERLYHGAHRCNMFFWKLIADVRRTKVRFHKRWAYAIQSY